MKRLACLIWAAAISCAAQSNTSPHFEVVSIKPVGPEVRLGYSGGPGSADPTRITYSKVTVRTLIRGAFPAYGGRISGPDWLDATYAVTAKLAPGTTDEQLRQMTANLLAERFGLVFHSVTKEVSAFDLVVSGKGTKLKPLPPLAEGEAQPPFSWQMHRVDERTVRHTFNRAPVGALSGMLSREYHSGPVFDRTGLKGEYSFVLECPGPHTPLPAALLALGETAEHFDEPEVGMSSISAVLEKELGLKLNPVKEKLDFMVVDQLNRVPTEN